MKLRIVEVEYEGTKYAVQKRDGDFFGEWEFLQKKAEYEEQKWAGQSWGQDRDYVPKYCLSETLEESEMAFEKHLEYFRNKNRKVKVTRVIRTVKV